MIGIHSRGPGRCATDRGKVSSTQTYAPWSVTHRPLVIAKQKSTLLPTSGWWKLLYPRVLYGYGILNYALEHSVIPCQRH